MPLVDSWQIRSKLICKNLNLNQMRNIITWFEIPSVDINRAKTFYEALLDTKMDDIQDFGGLKMATFARPENSSATTGSIVQHAHYTPSHQGSLLYFDGGQDLAPMLARVEPAGGKILQPKTLISPTIGHMALFEDTEGNRMALFSQ
jgi:uncharacterized protein